MLLQVDVAALEIRTLAYLSQDNVLMQELLDGVDIHTDNQNKFGLPSRLIAKIFVFKLVYGASAYSFAKDPDFVAVSKVEKYWQTVIDAYYDKYKGVKIWHETIIRTVIETGKLITPTGRELIFEKRDGKYREPQIKNYPPQSLGADLVALARVSAFNRLNKLGYGESCLLVNTVHDSLILDYDSNICDIEVISNLLYSVFEDIPKNFEKMFKTSFNVPMACEIQYGVNWKDMEIYHA